MVTKETAVDSIDQLGLDDLAELASMTDQASVEKQRQQFPLLQWINGKPTEKKNGGVPYTGGWFISQDSAGDLQDIPGWTKDTFITRSGVEVPGFFKRDVEMAFLHMRRHWRVAVKNNRGEDRTVFFPWNQYAKADNLAATTGKKPSGSVQMLVWVKGLDVLNPMVVTAKGYVSAELTGGRNNEGVLGAFSSRVVGTINTVLQSRKAKNILPWRAFWLNIGPRRNADNTPEYTKVGQGTDTSTITLPALIGVPKRPRADEVEHLFVGKELFLQLNDLWAEPRCSEWARAWDEVSEEDDRVEPADSSANAKISSIDIDGDSVGGGAADLGAEEIPF